jgi:2-oxoglutarate dehydrogenase E2 component (dihydrolipoamide succinyltransferase)
VKVGDVLGAIAEGAGAEGAEKAESAEKAAAESAEAGEPARAPGAGSENPRDADGAQGGREHAVDLTSVKGSGDAGRVMRRDVESAAAPAQAGTAAPQAAAQAKQPEPARKPAPAPPVQRRAPGERTEERVRMSKRRATIARRLVEAQSTAAMLTTFNEVDMSGVMALRERHKEPFKERHGVGLGIASFFVKAAIGALRAFPRLNAEIQGDEMVLKHYYDIGIAVGAAEGLVVPVLRDADQMSFAEIEGQIRDFAKRAKTARSRSRT